MPFTPTIRAFLAVLLGLSTQVLVFYFGDLNRYVLSGLGLLSAAFLVYGCTVIAEKRGFSPWFGLAGLYSILGVGLLLILPARSSLPNPLLRTPFRDAHKDDRED